MAVNSTAQPISTTPVRDYWPRFRRRAIGFIILMQLVTTLLVGGALIAAGAFAATSVAFWIALIAISLAAIGVNLIVFSLLSEPTKNLLDALTHVAGEPTITTPPNPNAKRFSKTGLKQALQTIYELGADKGARVADTSTTNSHLVTALDATPTGFVVLDSQRQVTYSNQHAPIRHDQADHKVLDLSFLNEQTLDEWLDDCEEHAVHAEKVWQRVGDKVAGEEGRRIFDIYASYQKGSEAETVLTFVDRTQSYVPEEDDLDFIAFAAHELRGPITVIRGYLDVLQDEIGDTLAEDQKELLKRLVVSSNRLSSYINNILNASRFDRRHLQVHLKEDSISDIYDMISDDMQLRATSQNRALGVNIPTDLPTVAADRGSISEVLGNLIDNAIKYSNEGGAVDVYAAVKGDFVEVSVEDHGIGMPGNVVSSLFHKFYRSHRSRETVAGTGIGLYIVKAFVESHGGIVSVRSAEGAGSTFTFSLPIYSTVADKLNAGQTNNQELIEHGSGWIKNHAMYRG
jgi:signal transduction histidine kinase